MKQAMGKPYFKFVVMVLTSTVVMFVLMYMNTLEWDHVYFSESRAYMALVMGAAMAVIMLLFMLNMYPDRRMNGVIIIAGAVVFALALWLARSQATIEDASWMKAMIPHHSIAILTSERAHLSNPRVRALASEIVESQRREIKLMKELLQELDR